MSNVKDTQTETAPTVETRESTVSLDRVAHADFAGHLSDVFQLSVAPDRSLDMELIACTRFGGRTGSVPSSDWREPFSLLFRLADHTRLPQRIYSVSHPRMGSMQLFLVPIGPDERGMRLEAVFG